MFISAMWPIICIDSEPICTKSDRPRQAANRAPALIKQARPPEAVRSEVSPLMGGRARRSILLAPEQSLCALAHAERMLRTAKEGLEAWRSVYVKQINERRVPAFAISPPLPLYRGHRRKMRGVTGSIAESAGEKHRRPVELWHPACVALKGVAMTMDEQEERRTDYLATVRGALDRAKHPVALASTRGRVPTNTGRRDNAGGA